MSSQCPILTVKHPSISVKQTVAESNISEVFLLPLRLSATVLRRDVRCEMSVMMKVS